MNKLISAFFSLLGVSIIFACRNKSNFKTAAGDKTLLWEVSGGNLPSPSYFFGTMHLMCAQDAELTTSVKSLVKSVEQVYLEVDLDNASELLTGIMNLRKNEGNSLQATLLAADYQKVKAFFETTQPSVPFSMLELQPPLMISATVYEFLLPCEQKNGVEMKLIDEAYKEKKPTFGLETVAFQSSIFDSIPYDEQAMDLVKTIDNLEKNRVAMNEMIQVYKDQDIEKLYRLSGSEESITSKYMDLLLYRRNVDWVKKFSTIARAASTLFAVGAGHLGGSRGVLQLLKDEGYRIRPLEN
jgi:uncharacterized protein YbaP (TraB family)